MADSGKHVPLILASSSPRRIELLRELGIEFRSVPSDAAEAKEPRGSIAGLVEENALMKAMDVAGRFTDGLVIGADTVVVCDGILFGKPRDIEDARRIVLQLAGRIHQVYSGIAVVRIEDGDKRIAHEVTDVTFRPLSEAQIDRYFQMIDPLDKAGAYAIQGAGGIVIEKISGCYYNVVGLPLAVLDDLLTHFGIRLL